MQCIAQSPALPRRMCGTPTKTGLVIGSDPYHVRIARRWAYHSVRSSPALAHDVASVVSELASNALKHSASGLPGGSVGVELERTDLYLVLSVSDNGPRPDQPRTYPHIPPLCPERPSGNGLRFVESLTVYWDWTPQLSGTTVSARFER